MKQQIDKLVKGFIKESEDAHNIYYGYQQGGLVMPELATVEPVSTAHESMDMLMQNEMDRIAQEDIQHGAMRQYDPWSDPRSQELQNTLLEMVTGGYNPGAVAGMAKLANPGHVWDMLKKLTMQRGAAVGTHDNITKQVLDISKNIEKRNKLLGLPESSMLPNETNEILALKSIWKESGKEVNYLEYLMNEMLPYLNRPAAGKIVKKK